MVGKHNTRFEPLLLLMLKHYFVILCFNWLLSEKGWGFESMDVIKPICKNKRMCQWKINRVMISRNVIPPLSPIKHCSSCDFTWADEVIVLEKKDAVLRPVDEKPTGSAFSLRLILIRRGWPTLLICTEGSWPDNAKSQAIGWIPWRCVVNLTH